MATLKLNNVKKVYPGGVEAVHAFNLEIADKEFVVLVGPSGCGKSTTLRMIAGLEDISEGELYIDDKLVNDVDPKDRDIAMVFQSYALYPHYTVYDNMSFSLKLRKYPKEEIDRRVREAAKILNITDLLKRKPKALSGGQRQRVAIGRAIVREPSVFLMDEPLSNLDAKLRNQMRAEIIKLRQRIDTTFVYVTHDQTEAMTLGDRIVIMKDGWIMQVGTAQEVFDHPANMFVAGFIGVPQMNFFDAELVKTESEYCLKMQNAIIPLSTRIQTLLSTNSVGSQNVIVGCRPEHIQITNQSETSFKAIVEVSEMMGSEIHVHGKAADKEIIIRVPSTQLSKENRTGLAYGTELYLSFPADLIHIFDPKTENSLL